MTHLRTTTVGLLLLLLAPNARAQDGDSDTEGAPAAAVAVDAPVDRSGFPPRRYAYVASGLFLVGGLGVGWWAQGQAERAQHLESASASEDMLRASRASAATANAMYALAGLSLVYGLVLEFLPEQVADKADLTYRF